MYMYSTALLHGHNKKATTHTPENAQVAGIPIAGAMCLLPSSFGSIQHKPAVNPDNIEMTV